MAQHETDNEKMKAVAMLVSQWEGEHLLDAIEHIGTIMADRTCDHPDLEATEEEVTSPRHVGTVDVEPRWTCPHCGDLLSTVEEVDINIRTNHGEFTGNGHDMVVTETGWGGGPSTLGFRCPSCERFVSVPLEVEVTFD